MPIERALPVSGRLNVTTDRGALRMQVGESQRGFGLLGTGKVSKRFCLGGAGFGN